MDEILAEPNDAIAAPFIREPAAEYHAARGRHLTTHRLGDFASKGPQFFKRVRTGEIRPKDSSAYAVGRALHTLVLEGHREYESGYIVGGPVNERTGKTYGRDTKAFAKWIEEHAKGREVLSEQDDALIQRMNRGVRQSENAMRLLESGSPELVIRQKYHGTPCQIRMDWCRAKSNMVADLKTCGDIRSFERDAKRYGYAYQAAFYRSVYTLATGKRPAMFWIAVEKAEPFRCGVWRIAESVLAEAEAVNEANITALLRCERTGVWPTGYEEMRTFTAL